MEEEVGLVVDHPSHLQRRELGPGEMKSPATKELWAMSKGFGRSHVCEEPGTAHECVERFIEGHREELHSSGIQPTLHFWTVMVRKDLILTLDYIPSLSRIWWEKTVLHELLTKPQKPLGLTRHVQRPPLKELGNTSPAPSPHAHRW